MGLLLKNGFVDVKILCFFNGRFLTRNLGCCFRVSFNCRISSGLYVLLCSEYYFSTENLERDFFLRRKMDQQGFLPVSLIASFRRMQALTTNAALILEVKSFRKMCLLSCLVNSVLPFTVSAMKLRKIFVCNDNDSKKNNK